MSLTQSAALAGYRCIGSGSADMADKSAVEAMRQAFEKIPIKGEVVIGEGERDKAPMLYIGEKVGAWRAEDPEMHIAVDPLEGTNLCAKALNGAVSVLALSSKEGLFKAPDIYMEKIAGAGPLKGVIALDKSAAENVKSAGEVLSKNISDVKVSILNRPRHSKLIKSIYDLGAKVQLIEDGDLSAGILTARGVVDLMMGIGGAPEGVLLAGALKCLGGEFQGRFVFKEEKEKERARAMGMTDLDKIYLRDELSPGPVIFCMTGVTDGDLLKGVCRGSLEFSDFLQTESFYMDSKAGDFLKVKAWHKM